MQTQITLVTHNSWESGSGGWDKRQMLIGFYLEQSPDVLVLQEMHADQEIKRCFSEVGYELAICSSDVACLAVFVRGKILINEAVNDRIQFVQFEAKGCVIDLYNLHLPYHPQSDGERLRLVEDCLRHLTGNSNVVLCGDINSLCSSDARELWGEEFIARRAGMNRPPRGSEWTATIDLLRVQGFVDAFRLVSQAAGNTYQPPTYKFYDFPGLIPLLELSRGAAVAEEHEFATGQIQETFERPCLRIDYIFVGPSIAPSVIECKVIESARELSDHLPLGIRMNMTKGFV